MTVTYPKHDKTEDEEEEECSGGQIHDGRGEANGDVTEVRHGDSADQRVINFTRISLNLSVRSGGARYYLDGPILFLIIHYDKESKAKFVCLREYCKLVNLFAGERIKSNVLFSCGKKSDSEV